MGSITQDLWQDARYGARLLMKKPTFTLVAVFTLALGIGATSAIFSVLDAVVLRPLPFADPEQLVWITETNNQGRNRPPSARVSEAWRQESETISNLGGLGGLTEFSLTGENGAERIAFGDVGLTSLETLGVRPVLGRWFRPDEVVVQGDTSQTVVISYGVWQRIFGGDPNVLGKPLPGWTTDWGRIVIGVMPPGFWIHPSMARASGWYAFDYARIPGARVPIVARMKPGVAMEQAQAELNTIARRHDPAQTSANPDQTWRVRVEPLHDVFKSQYSETLYLLLGAVAFVLLIAAVNVTNLQMTRGFTRHPEMATRAALGAARWRLLRQLMVENILLALAGGVLGVAVAFAGIRIFVSLAPDFYPPTDEIHINGIVLLFTLAIALFAGIVSGLAPAFRTSRPDLHDTLKQGARSGTGRVRQGVRRALVVVEMAMALVLLVGAGLMINTYVRVMGTDMRFNPKNVLAFEVALSGFDRYRTRHDARHFSVTPQVADLYTNALAQIAAQPGVQSAAITSSLPPEFALSPPVRVVGGREQGEGASNAQLHEISADYFDVLGIPLVRGRRFTGQDTETSAGVVIINETMAKRFFGDADPIGRLLEIDINRGNPALEKDRPREVVGVVRDTRAQLRNETPPVMYIPYQQHLSDYAGSGPFFVHARKNFVVRTAADNPMSIIGTIRKIFTSIDPAVAIDNVSSMEQRLADSAGGERFWMRLLGIFAGLAVFLAAMGIYGVISYSVEQRIREFGLRAALGAQKSDILRLVLREGLVVTLIGLVVGIAGAFGLTRLIANQLYGVTPMDPATITVVSLVLLAIALLGCYIPGRRAAATTPLIALRTE